MFPWWQKTGFITFEYRFYWCNQRRPSKFATVNLLKRKICIIPWQLQLRWKSFSSVNAANRTWGLEGTHFVNTFSIEHFALNILHIFFLIFSMFAIEIKQYLLKTLYSIQITHKNNFISSFLKSFHAPIFAFN